MPHGDDANTILVLKADNVFRIHAYFKTFYTVKSSKKFQKDLGSQYVQISLVLLNLNISGQIIWLDRAAES